MSFASVRRAAIGIALLLASPVAMAQSLAEAKVLRTFRAAIDDGLQRLGRLHARRVVYNRVLGIIEHSATQRGQVQ